MATQDEEHLKLLSIFHYVVGGLTLLLGCVPVLHLAVGVLFVRGGPPGPPGELGKLVESFGWFFIGAAMTSIAFFWTLALLMILAGRNLAAHRKRGFCNIVAGLECLQVPLGTILGVFTLIVLSRDGVKRLFGEPVDLV